METVVLAQRGVNGYRQYRIPALACTPSGRLIAIYDGRYDLDDLPAAVDLVMRTSDDGGKSWSPQSVFRTADGIAGFGDASILIDPSVGEHGRIFVFYQSSQIAGFFESIVGSDESDPRIVQISLSESDDDGMTWRHRTITSQLKDEKTEGIFITSGTGGRLTAGAHAGRLLHACVIKRDNTLSSAIIYSDDHGATWQMGAAIERGNETAVVGLPDGSVLFHSRSTPFRLSGRSLDGGTTLSERGPVTELPDPSDNGSLTVLSDGSIIATHNHDSALRRNTVAKRSLDGGRTWPQALVLAPDSSAYSTACELPNGDIGFLFERHGYVEMVFARAAISEFKPTSEVVGPKNFPHDIECAIVFRYIKPARNSAAEERISGAQKRWIPQVDMSVFNPAMRKEIGNPKGDASGEAIYTREEYKEVLGPISPELHVGDEVRFSGRLTNHGSTELTNISITSESFSQQQDRLQSGKDFRFLDVRFLVTESDIAANTFHRTFTWSATQDGKQLQGEVVQKISIKDGLPI